MFCIPSKHNFFVKICTVLDQRQRRWAEVAQMLYKCFVFAGEFSLTSLPVNIYIFPCVRYKKAVYTNIFSRTNAIYAVD